MAEIVACFALFMYEKLVCRPGNKTINIKLLCINF